MVVMALRVRRDPLAGRSRCSRFLPSVGVPWVEVFAVFVVCHLGGDFILQTEFQATNKHGGLRGTPTQRRALGSHTLTYTLAYLPAFLWLAGDVSALGLVPTVLGGRPPARLQDDGTAMRWWMRTVKHTRPPRACWRCRRPVVPHGRLLCWRSPSAGNVGLTP